MQSSTCARTRGAVQWNTGRADDLDVLRNDPAFKPACGRLPDSGRDLCSRPTVSRWENAPRLREVIRLAYAMIDICCASYAAPPRAITLDIDDTVDVVHGAGNLHCSTAIMGNAASCRSTSMKPPRRARWRCCCAPARPHRGRRFATICAGWSGASAAIGRTPG